jgi:hypothetical protein
MKHEVTSTLTAAIHRASEAAEKLLKCAESISNPTYSVVMQGERGELQILAVRHFQGQIILTVQSPFNAVPERQWKTINQDGVLEHDLQPARIEKDV